MSEHGLTHDIPFGEFEGTLIEVYTAAAKNSKIHAGLRCSQLRSANTRTLTLPLNADMVKRMCRACAQYGPWGASGTAVGIFLNALSGTGLLWQLEYYAGPDDDDPDAEDVAHAGQVLQTARRTEQEEVDGEDENDEDDKDDEEEKWQERRAAEEMRDRLLSRWRHAADSLYDAWRVVDMYPWLEPWARRRLQAKADYVEEVRQSLSQLINKRNLTEAAAVHALSEPEIPADVTAFSYFGDAGRIRDELGSAWREWSRHAATDWQELSAHGFLAYYAVDGDRLLGGSKPRSRRKGRNEAIDAVGKLYTVWAESARRNLDAAEEGVRLVVVTVPEADERPEYGGRDNCGFDRLLSKWQVGILSAWAVASDWRYRVMLLRVPESIGSRMLEEQSSLVCEEFAGGAVPDQGAEAALEVWVREHKAPCPAGPLTGVFDDTPVSGRRVLTASDVKVLRSASREKDQPCIVFSVTGGVEVRLLSSLEKECADGWNGVMLAGPGDLPASLIDPWVDEVLTKVRSTAEGEGFSWRREPSSAAEPDFGAEFGMDVGDLECCLMDLGDDDREIKRRLRTLAIARGADDLRLLGQKGSRGRALLSEGVWHGLLAISLLDLTPFMGVEEQSWRSHGMNLPLSILADVQAYSIVGSSPYSAGKWHSPFCHHMHRYGRVDFSFDRLSLADLLGPGNRNWCNNCAGYSVKRLSRHQVRYYRAAHRLCEINEMAAPRRGGGFGGDERSELSDAVLAELDELAEFTPDPREISYDGDNLDWSEAVRAVRAVIEKK